MSIFTTIRYLKEFDKHRNKIVDDCVCLPIEIVRDIMHTADALNDPDGDYEPGGMVNNIDMIANAVLKAMNVEPDEGEEE